MMSEPRRPSESASMSAIKMGCFWFGQFTTTWVRKIQGTIIGKMDRFFYNHGKRVAQHPYLHISICLLVTALCGVGLIKFREENNIIKLWIPEDSSQRVNTDWLWANYPNERRYASMIFVADNILVPEVIKTIYQVHKSIDSLISIHGDTWQDVCERVPIVQPPSLSSVLWANEEEYTTPQSGENWWSEPEAELTTLADFPELTTTIPYQETVENTTSDPFNRALHYSLNLYPDPFCDLVYQMPLACMEWSILELWANDGAYDVVTDELIENLTVEDILDKVNNQKTSGVFLLEKNFHDYLGQVTYNEAGDVIGAKATIVRWFSKLNSTAALSDPVKDRDEPIDQRTLDFEEEMIKAMLNTTAYPEGLLSYPNVQRSFGDVASSTIVGDISFLAAGFAIVLLYIMIMLGKFSWVEQRIYLSLAGIISIVMGIIVAYGICSAAGLFFGPMHNILPLLLLGIGIDDMFVIVQGWETLSENDHREKSLVERFGIVMMHSGVAITITSVTDIAAFGLGGVTILPALKSFCLFSSVGIVAIYWFICTFFVALMSIDQKRIEDSRDGLLPCIKHKKVVTLKTKEGQSFSSKAFEIYGSFLMTTPAKISAITFSLALTGISCWGNVILEQKFVPAWFLPPESYLYKWFQANEVYFPFGGDRVTVWMSGLDYENEMESINNLALSLKNQTDIIDAVDAWTTEYLDYIQLPSASLSSWDGDFNQFTNDSYFYHKLTQFLFSPKGAKYRQQFKFEFDPWCGYGAPNIFMTDLTFTHKVFKGPSEHIPAMNRVKKIIQDANLTGKVFPLSQGYASWETDEVITFELYRNLGLAILCIFITTTVFIGHLVCSLLVMGMVLLSLVHVAGMITFWGLTIDTVSCVNLIIAIGLCVDYSAHIGHRFLVEQEGSREDRVKKTLKNIGPAVLNGGLSTFIAFILLANSKSHVFITFFKIFLLVVVFGLYQGLVLLPVILSLVGPRPNPNVLDDETKHQNNGNVNQSFCNENDQSNSSKTFHQNIVTDLKLSDQFSPKGF